MSPTAISHSTAKKVPYPAAFYPHTLTCFSYSKSLSLPGERLGYVAVRPGCEGEDVLVDMMAQISRFTGHNCPPSIIQRAVSRCQDVTSDLSVYETNMNLLYDKLTALGFEVERPGGTFYIFPKALEEDANAFCMRPGSLTCCWCPATASVSRAMCALPTASIPKRSSAACRPLKSWQPLTANKHSAELPARHLAVQRGWRNDPKRGKGTLLWKRSK